jgi:hypothetical protein
MLNFTPALMEAPGRVEAGPSALSGLQLIELITVSEAFKHSEI